ncbi:MAG: F0F1 ATP synthase subunit alpha [Bacteriovoracia bacterium]
MAFDVRPEEISRIIKERIQNYETKLEVDEVGTVLTAGDGVARAFGLQNAISGELVEFDTGTKGMVLNLEKSNVGIAILGDQTGINEGSIVRRTKEIVKIPTGEALLGRVINALGEPLDGHGDIDAQEYRLLENKAPGIIDRQSVHEPLQTGIKAIDAMTPIGRGQRELILGDRKTGKTQIAIDTIINQKDTDVKCIYVAIGQKQSTIKLLQNKLVEYGAMDYTTIIAAPAADPAPLQYIAPYAGTALGEYFRDNGQHALIIYDDLTKHAQAYRQISLLLRRPPGREAYPGDIFYLHSRLLERSAKLNEEAGGGSLTSLPIVETQEGDVSAYIPTNIISITDGQIYLEADLFNAGVRPAINAGLSVSRVGGAAQIPALKKIAGTLRISLAQFRELEVFAQFGSDLDQSTRDTLDRGRVLIELLKQRPDRPMNVIDQIVVVFAGTNGLLDKVPPNEISNIHDELLEYMHKNEESLLQQIKTEMKFSKDLMKLMKETIRNFLQRYNY